MSLAAFIIGALTILAMSARVLFFNKTRKQRKLNAQLQMIAILIVIAALVVIFANELV